MEKDVIEVRGKKFSLCMTEEEIMEGVSRVAKEISEDFKGRNPLFIVTLKGAFMFASDLLKRIDFPCEVAFVRLSSYVGMASTGHIQEVLPMGESVEGREVVVIEDIVDTGTTMNYFLKHLKELKAKEVRLASFLAKPAAIVKEVKIDYLVSAISNNFVIGYGVDYDQIGRNMPALYQAVE